MKRMLKADVLTVLRVAVFTIAFIVFIQALGQAQTITKFDISADTILSNPTLPRLNFQCDIPSDGTTVYTYAVTNRDLMALTGFKIYAPLSSLLINPYDVYAYALDNNGMWDPSWVSSVVSHGSYIEIKWEKTSGLPYYATVYLKLSVPDWTTIKPDYIPPMLNDTNWLFQVGVSSSYYVGNYPPLPVPLAWSPSNPPTVSNVTAHQRPDGSKKVDIYYNLSDSDTERLFVTVQGSSDGGSTFNVPVNSLSGDVGVGVPQGKGKHIIWDAGTDLPGAFGTNYKICVTARD